MSRTTLARPALARNIAASLAEGRSVLIHAPFGYGKTTLAKSLAATRGAVWYEAAPWDGDAFVGPLVECVRSVRSGFGRGVGDLLQERAPFGRVGAAFAAELARVPERIVVVLDDVHLLEEVAFGQFLAGAVQRLSPNAALVVLARAVPAINAGEMVVKGRLEVFGPDSLAFGEDDVAGLARLHGLSEERVRKAVAEADGWPAGVDLLLADESKRGHLFGSLTAMIDEGDLRLLRHLAVFERVDATALGSLPGNGEDVLRRLARRGVLVERKSDGKGWVIHPMLREALLAQLRQGDPAAEREANVAAAKAYARAGRIAPALFHLEKCDDVETMLELRGHAIAALLSGDTEQIVRFAARARGAGVKDEPLFAFIAAYRAKSYGMNGVREAFAAAVDVCDAHGDEALGFESRIQIVEHDLARGDRVEDERIRDIRERAARLGPVQESSAAVRAGWNEVVCGRFESALAYALDAPSTENVVEQSLVMPLRAYAKTALGHFESADEEMARFLEALEDGSPRMYRRMLVWAARLAWLRGDARAALEYAQHAERTGRSHEAGTEAAMLHLTLAETAIHAGDHRTALAAARATEEAASHAWYARDRERARDVAKAVRARAKFLAKKNPAEALRETLEDLETTKQAVVRAALWADAAWYAHLAKDERRAALLKKAREEVERAACVDAHDVVTVADAAQQVGFLERANGARRPPPAFESGPFENLVAKRAGMPAFSELAEHLRTQAFDEALERYTARGARFEAFLARMIAGPGDARKTPAGLPEDLTQREMEILVLLVGGLTNKEIAQRLTMSPRTAETHVSSILGKMQVNTRARAISKAIALGLVPEPSAP